MDKIINAKKVHNIKRTISFSGDVALYMDFYGGLLTEKQVEILDCYYNEDYSLSEIANGLGISRQAAHDAIRSGSQALVEYEEKLGMVNAYLCGLKREDETRKVINELRAVVAQIRETTAGNWRSGQDQHAGQQSAGGRQIEQPGAGGRQFEQQSAIEQQFERLCAIAQRLEKNFTDNN